MTNPEFVKRANELANAQTQLQADRKKQHRAIRREINRRLEQFLDYASAGNMMALQNILNRYQEVTRDNQ